MNTDNIMIAAMAALGPTVAALAAWRQAKGTRNEVATNHGKRAGEYLEMLGQMSANMHILKIEARTSSARLAKKLETLHSDHGEILTALDARVTSIEQVLSPPDLERGRIAQ